MDLLGVEAQDLGQHGRRQARLPVDERRQDHHAHAQLLFAELLERCVALAAPGKYTHTHTQNRITTSLTRISITLEIIYKIEISFVMNLKIRINFRISLKIIYKIWISFMMNLTIRIILRVDMKIIYKIKISFMMNFKIRINFRISLKIINKIGMRIG